MKHKIFTTIAILLIYATGALAQSYSEESGQRWNVLTMPTFTTIPSCTIILHSDNQHVQYGNYVYKMLYCNSDDIINLLYGIYREENGKVFMRENPGGMWPATEEFLLYDWEMNIGDTAYVQRGDWTKGLVLDNISDTLMNGSQRRIFHLHYMNNDSVTEIWIEGMGSELGFPYSGTKDNPVSPFYYPMTAELLCYYENGDLSWDNPHFDECIINYWLDVENVSEESVLCLYPNPTQDCFTIKYTNNNVSTIKIFDMFGHEIYNDIMESSEKIINTNMFPDGVYYVLLQNTKDKLHTMLIKY